MQIINEPSASNGDELLFVQFFKMPVIKEFESEQQGRPIYEERTMVRIQAPGDMLSIVEREANESHKRRFPRQWAHFEATQTEASDMNGTPVESWAAISRAQAEELRAMKFRTVEQLASASDMQLQTIGMGGFGLRTKARAFLEQAKDSALVERQAAELARRDEEIERLKTQMAQIAAQVSAQAEKRGPGRPRKEERAA